MKIAIRADGGPAIGMGHLIRCSAIARRAVLLGHTVCFFTRAKYAKYIGEMGFDVSALPDCSNVESEAAAFIKVASDYGADCALVDNYEWTEPCYIKTKEKLYTVVIDDCARLLYSADILINANLYASELDYSRCKVTAKLLGGRYAILREEFKDIPPAKIGHKVQRVLVTMGGADINNYTPVVLKELSDISGLEIIVVAGPLTQCADAIKNTAECCKSKITIMSAPGNIAEIIGSCDIAISSAGTTVYELCAMGVPSILIMQADNQSLICDYFRKTGYMQVLGDYKDVKHGEIAAAFNLYLDSPKLREKLQETLLTLVDRNGTGNIVNAVQTKMRGGYK